MRTLNDALGLAAIFLSIGVGFGSCSYLDAAGTARVNEAKAALVLAQQCKPEARP